MLLLGLGGGREGEGVGLAWNFYQVTSNQEGDRQTDNMKVMTIC